MLNLKDGTLWQWDTGRKVLITLDVGHKVDTVQFYNGIGDSARKGVIEREDDGSLIAHIPNVLLQYENNLTVYLMSVDEDGQKTQEQITLTVNKRAKPEDYVFTDNEIITYRIYNDRLMDVEENKASIEQLGNAVEELEGSIAATNSIAENAVKIAEGRNRAHVFNTTEDMEAWLSNPDNAGLWIVGDNIYIVDMEVTDWWIHEVLTEPDEETGFYYKIAKLEVQKVDLSGIVSDISTLQSQVQTLQNEVARLQEENVAQQETIELQQAKLNRTPEFIITDTEPTEVTANTVVMVYEV